MPTISVIVPVYNIEEEISKCLLSILLQKFSDFEIIAVDDGSTDKSSEILDEFAKKYEQIRVFHTKNRGLSAARNFGIRKARGKYLAFVDGDDFIDPDFLEKLYRAISDSGAEISVSGYTEFFEDNIRYFLPKNETISGEEATIRFLTKQENLEILTWNKLYLKELFKDIQFPVGEVNEDNLTTYKLLSRAKKVSYISAALYNYVRRENSISFTTSDFKRDKMREKTVLEAKKFFEGNAKLLEANEMARLLMYFKFVDHSIAGRVEKKYFRLFRSRIMRRRKDFRKNKFVDRKRRFYISLLSIFGGKFYILFRKINH